MRTMRGRPGMAVSVPAVIVVLGVVLAGCASGDGSSTAATSPETTVREIGPTSTEVLGGLTIRITFDDTTVEAGDRLPSRLQVENTSGHVVTDPGCVLGEYADVVTPVTDSDAELWHRTVTDCGGPFDYPDGFSDEGNGPGFLTHTPTGEPLPPGDYIAAVEIDGQRLEYPVEVIEQTGTPDPLRGL